MAEVYVSYGILLIVVTLAASAHLMLKVGMTQVGRVGTEELRAPAELLSGMLSNPLILVATLLYAGSFIAWTIILSRLQLSQAYPALSITYLIIPLGSWFTNLSLRYIGWGLSRLWLGSCWC